MSFTGCCGFFAFCIWSPAAKDKGDTALGCSDTQPPAAEVRALPQVTRKRIDMTTQPTDDGTNLETENLQSTATKADDDFTSEDHDPMIAEMKAAEAKVAAEEGTQETAAAEASGDVTDPAAQPAAVATKDKGPMPMIPKARLDEVLSENTLLRDQVGYLRGLADARKLPEATAPAAKPAEGQSARKPAEAVGAVDAIETAISAAEEKKLALAERYDNGEISNKQMVQEQIAIDKEIRGLSNQRIDKMQETARTEAQAVVATNNFETVKNNVGLQLQAKHPGVAVIDALPPNMRDGVWKDITTQATANLAAKGIDVKSGPQAKLLLIQEKARLTDDLSAFGLQGKAPQPAAPSGQPTQPKISPTALNRQAKIELANSQPPSITDMGAGADNAEITDDDIARMSEDQMADLIQKAPQRIQRLLGGSQNGG